MSRSLALLALSGAVIAQKSTTADILLPGWDAENLAASIVDVEDSLTTFALNCVNKDAVECGLPDGGTIIQGESSWSQHMSFENESEQITYTQDYKCQLERAKEMATCTINHSEMFEGELTKTSTVESLSDLSSYIYPIEVTAGADKLTAAPGATTSVAGTTMTSAGAETGAATTGGPEATGTLGGDDGEDAAASLRISGLGIFAVVGGVLALL